jgi:Family of unknown function (DUF6801)
MARRLRGFRLTALACALAVTGGALVSASGVLADATPGAAQAVHARLAYRCRFPSGPRPVSVTVAGTFPATATAGQPIKPSRLRTTVAFPRSAVAGPGGLGAAKVAGHDVLSATVADQSAVTTVHWPGRLPKPVHIPRTGRARLAFAGPVPPVTPNRPGSVTFSAAAFTIDLYRASGGTVNLASVQATCTLSPGRQPKLATVPVTAAPAPAHSPGVTRGRHAKGAIPNGKVPHGCVKRIVKGGTTSPTLGCAYLLGYADVLKLKESALLGPAFDGSAPAAFLHVDSYATETAIHHGRVHVYVCSAAQLDYHKLLQFPPAKVTFLNFGFVPVTAVMSLVETKWPSNHPPVENKQCYIGNVKNKPVHLKSPIVTVFSNLNDDAAEKLPVLNTSETYLAIHISQVTVNGVPINVGPNCGTTQPVRAVLIGHGHNGPPPTGYTLDNGGPLAGSVTIPKLSHCGVGENLDPLFDASISGPMNFQLMTQGTLCTPQNASLCPPSVPKPRRHV